MLMRIIRIVGLSGLVGMGMEVNRFSMPVKMKMNAFPHQTTQHIQSQKNQHNADSKFQALGKVRWN